MPDPSQSSVDLERAFLLDDVRVNPATNEIARARVDAKAMDVLLAIARTPDVRSLQSLLEQVRPDVVVVDNVVHQAVA